METAAIASSPPAHPPTITTTAPPRDSAEVRYRLLRLDGRVPEIARRAGMQTSELRKIATGHVRNPGIDTVAKFWPHVVAMERALAVLDAATPRPPSPGAPP